MTSGTPPPGPRSRSEEGWGSEPERSRGRRARGTREVSRGLYGSTVPGTGAEVARAIGRQEWMAFTSCVRDLHRKYPGAITASEQYVNKVLGHEPDVGFMVKLTNREIRQIEDQLITPLIEHLRRSLGLPEEERRRPQYRREREEEEYRPRERYRSRRREESELSSTEGESTERARSRGRRGHISRESRELSRQLKAQTDALIEQQRTTAEQQARFLAEREELYTNQMRLEREEHAQKLRVQEEQALTQKQKLTEQLDQLKTELTTATKEQQQIIQKQQQQLEQERAQAAGKLQSLQQEKELAAQEHRDLLAAQKETTNLLINQNQDWQQKCEAINQQLLRAQTANAEEAAQLAAQWRQVNTELQKKTDLQVQSLRDELAVHQQLSTAERTSLQTQLQQLQQTNLQQVQKAEQLERTIAKLETTQTEFLTNVRRYQTDLGNYQTQINQLLQGNIDQMAAARAEQVAAVREEVQNSLSQVRSANETLRVQLEKQANQNLEDQRLTKQLLKDLQDASRQQSEAANQQISAAIQRVEHNLTQLHGQASRRFEENTMSALEGFRTAVNTGIARDIESSLAIVRRALETEIGNRGRELTRANEQLSQRITELDRVEKQLSTQLGQLTAAQSRITQDIQGFQATLNQLAAKKGPKDPAEIEQIVTQLHTKISGALIENAQAIDRLRGDLQRKNEEFEKEKAELAKTVHANVAEVIRLREQEVSNERIRIESSISTLSQMQKTLQSQMEQVNAKVVTFTDAQEALSNRITEYQTRIGELQKDIKGIKSSTEKLTGLKTEITQSNNIASARMSRIEKQLREQTRLLEIAEEERTKIYIPASVAETNDRVNATLLAATQLMNDLKAGAESLVGATKEELAAKSEAAIAAVKQTLGEGAAAASKDTLAAVAKMNEALDAQLEQARTVNTQMTQELAGLRQVGHRFNEQIDEVNNQINQRLAQMGTILTENATKYQQIFEELEQRRAEADKATLEANLKTQEELATGIGVIDDLVKAAQASIVEFTSGVKEGALAEQAEALSQQAEQLNGLKKSLSEQLTAIQTTIDEKLSTSTKELDMRMSSLELQIQSLIERPTIPEGVTQQLQNISALGEDIKNFTKSTQTQAASIEKRDAAKSAELMRQNEQLTQRMAQLEMAAKQLSAKSDEVTLAVKEFSLLRGTANDQQVELTKLVRQLGEKIEGLPKDDQAGREQALVNIKQVQTSINQLATARQQDSEKLSREIAEVNRQLTELAERPQIKEGVNLAAQHIAEVATLKERLENLTQTHTALSEQHAQLEIAKNELAKSAERAHTDLKAAQENALQQETRIKELQGENSRLLGKTITLSQELSDIRSNKEANGRNLDQFSKENRQLFEENQSLKKQLQEKIDAASGEGTAAKLKAANEDLERQTEILTKRDAEITNLKKEAETQEEERQRLIRDLEDTRRELSQNRASARGLNPEELSKLRDTNAQQQQKIGVLESDIRELEIKNKRLTHKLEMMRLEAEASRGREGRRESISSDEGDWLRSRSPSPTRPLLSAPAPVSPDSEAEEALDEAAAEAEGLGIGQRDVLEVEAPHFVGDMTSRVSEFVGADPLERIRRAAEEREDDLPAISEEDLPPAPLTPPPAPRGAVTREKETGVPKKAGPTQAAPRVKPKAKGKGPSSQPRFIEENQELQEEIPKQLSQVKKITRDYEKLQTQVQAHSKAAQLLQKQLDTISDVQQELANMHRNQKNRINEFQSAEKRERELRQEQARLIQQKGDLSSAEKTALQKAKSIQKSQREFLEEIPRDHALLEAKLNASNELLELFSTKQGEELAKFLTKISSTLSKEHISLEDPVAILNRVKELEEEE